MSSEKFLSPLTTITYIRTYILIDRDREREREREREKGISFKVSPHLLCRR